MIYNIITKFLASGDLLVAEMNNRKIAVFRYEQEQIYLAHCDDLEYTLLKKFFAYAEKAFSAPLPPPCHRTNPVAYYGCMLGVRAAEKKLLLQRMAECGAQWYDDIEDKRLSVIIGTNWSNNDTSIFDSLRRKWQYAEIFTLPGFRNLIKNGVNDDYLRMNFNNFIKCCEFDPSTGCFVWPFSGVYPTWDLFDFQAGLPKRGVLATMGYHVGVGSGLSQTSRRAILKEAYIGNIPFVQSVDHMREWGAPGSARRLRKIIDCLTAFAENARNKRRHELERCIDEWEGDRDWLMMNFSDIQKGII